MKYILTSGCSFTNNQRLNVNELDKEPNDRIKSWPWYLQLELGDKYKVLNLGGATNDNVSITRILLYHTKKLINEGVNPSDIIIIGQWSDPNREAIWVDCVFGEEEHKLSHTLTYTPNWEKDNGAFFLTGGYYPHEGGKEALEYFDIYNAITHWEAEVSWNNRINPTLHWLESWSHLERFCEKNNIKTYWMSMRNIYSKEAFDNYFGAPDNNSDSVSGNNWMFSYEILKPYLNEVPIDENNHWHYKNYNGLLEWTLDNYGTLNPFQETTDITMDEYLLQQPNGWGHPSNVMMDKFVKEELIKML